MKHFEALQVASGGLEARPHELDEKHRRVQKWLEQAGYDGVLLRRHENIAWVTAGQVEVRVAILSETGVLALLLLRDGRRFSLAPNNEAGRLAVEELPGLGYEPVVRPWYSLDFAAEAQRMTGAKLASDTVLTTEAGSLPIVDLAPLRAPLLPAEIARFRVLGKQSAHVVAAVLLALNPGVSEYEMEARVAVRLLREGVFPSVLLMGTDDRILNYKHAVARGATLERFGMLNLCARRWGLAVSITRFVHFGKLPAELERGFNTAATVNAALQHATRNGATGGSLFRVATHAYVQAGFPGEEQLHHQGGACGYLEREWVATPDGTQTVHEPEAFAWNPSCRGGKVEDTTLAMDGKIEVLTRTPQLPEVTTEVGGVVYTTAGVLIRP